MREQEKREVEKKYPVCPDVSSRVMEKIKTSGIKMKSREFCFVEKMGTRVAYWTFLFAGLFMLGSLMYFLDKSGILGFLFVGPSGFETFLEFFPFDYLALSSLALFLAFYFSGKVKGSCIEDGYCPIWGGFFILLAFISGTFFVFKGGQVFYHNLKEERLSREDVIFGKIEKISSNRVFVRGGDGKFFVLTLEKENLPDWAENDSRGLYLRAVGKKNLSPEGFYQFDHRKIYCCHQY